MLAVLIKRVLASEMEATYEEFVSTASILIVEDTKLLKPKVSW